MAEIETLAGYPEQTVLLERNLRAWQLVAQPVMVVTDHGPDEEAVPALAGVGEWQARVLRVSPTTESELRKLLDDCSPFTPVWKPPQRLTTDCEPNKR